MDNVSADMEALLQMDLFTFMKPVAVLQNLMCFSFFAGILFCNKSGIFKLGKCWKTWCVSILETSNCRGKEQSSIFNSIKILVYDSLPITLNITMLYWLLPNKQYHTFTYRNSLKETQWWMTCCETSVHFINSRKCPACESYLLPMHSCIGDL